jgi:hypothetical protein
MQLELGVEIRLDRSGVGLGLLEVSIELEL